jgi:SAM-dependent methyltransferase
LRSQSIDLVLCAQSFHWFRPKEVLPEFARILRRAGRLAIVWNRRRASDPLTAGYRQAIVDAGGAITVEGMNFAAEVIPRSGVFSSAERIDFSNPQRLDLDGLIGRARSASYAPKSGAAGEQLLSKLRALHTQYADSSGFVTLAQDTEVFLSTRV